MSALLVKFESKPAIVPKKKKLQEMNLFHVVFPVYVFARLFGFLPYSIRWSKKKCIKSVRVTFFDVLWFISAISIYTILAVFTVSLGFYAKVIQSSILIIGARLILFFGLFIGVLAICMDMFNRNKSFRILMQLHAVDREVFPILLIFSNFICQKQKIKKIRMMCVISIDWFTRDHR